MNYENRLRKNDWHVETVPLLKCQEMVKEYHYAKGGSNTATYRHGLFKNGSGDCMGIAWWIPPTKSAANATYPLNWRGVLALSRMVINPSVPKNACTFLLAKSMKLIDRGKWPCLVTYADEWQGHTGTIYKACNWVYFGMTKPEAVYVKDGRMIARKAGPKTRTKAEMLAMGANLKGKFSKHKYVDIVKYIIKDNTKNKQMELF